MIERQRCLEKSRTCKSNHANTVAAKVADKGFDLKLGFFEAVGLNILCKHAQRCVDHENDVYALALGPPFFVAPLRTCEREHETKHGKRHENRTDKPLAFPVTLDQFGKECFILNQPMHALLP